MYVDDARDAASVLCRECRLVEVGARHAGSVERGEDASEVAHLVKWKPVEEEEVLVVFSTADIESAESLHALCHSRLQLYGLYQVGLAEDDGHGEQVVRLQGVQAHLQAFGVSFRGISCDDGLVEDTPCQRVVL